MSENKNLVVICAHPNTELSCEILKKCISSFNSQFDIALATHYPVSSDIQSLCKYYIYDANNQILEENNPIVWFKNDLFYLQIKHVKNHAYSAYSSILNAIRFLQTIYDDFFYINGDTIFSEDDIVKLLTIKNNVIFSGKKSCFFREFKGMVDAKIFYSHLHFFINNISNVKTKNDFIKYTSQFNNPYIPNVLESFYAERIDNYFFNEVYIINENLEKYFDTSQIDVLSSFNGKSEYKKDYNIHLVKENNSNRIFFVYINNNVKYEPKKIYIKINEEEFVLDNGCYSIYKEVVMIDKKVIISVENTVQIYYEDDILNNIESYIQIL